MKQKTKTYEDGRVDSVHGIVFCFTARSVTL